MTDGSGSGDGGGGGAGVNFGTESARSVAAAGAALGALRDLMGPRIFAGRLDERQRRVVEASAEVPPPAGAFAPPSGGGSMLLRGGAGGGAFVGATPTTVRVPYSSSSSFPVPLGAGARPEGYCPGGMPLRK